jgi:hypothetical protein
MSYDNPYWSFNFLSFHDSLYVGKEILVPFQVGLSMEAHYFMCFFYILWSLKSIDWWLLFKETVIKPIWETYVLFSFSKDA